MYKCVLILNILGVSVGEKPSRTFFNLLVVGFVVFRILWVVVWCVFGGVRELVGQAKEHGKPHLCVFVYSIGVEKLKKKKNNFLFLKKN